MMPENMKPHFRPLKNSGSNARQLSESCSARIEEIRLEKEAQEKAERETAVLDRAQAFYDEGLYPDAVEALQGFRLTTN